MFTFEQFECVNLSLPDFELNIRIVKTHLFEYIIRET